MSLCLPLPNVKGCDSHLVPPDSAQAPSRVPILRQSPASPSNSAFPSSLKKYSPQTTQLFPQVEENYSWIVDSVLSQLLVIYIVPRDNSERLLEAEDTLFADGVSFWLECSGVISAHCNLCLLGSSYSPASASPISRITGAHHHTWLVFVLSVDMEFLHVGHAGLKLLTSSDLPTSASQSADIRGMSHCTQANLIFLTCLSSGYYNPHFINVLYCIMTEGGRINMDVERWVSPSLAQVDLKLLSSRNPPTSASQSDGITGLSSGLALSRNLVIDK
ncbi:hypothetical protein AAY473_002152 [Plecturocebus cupreus]